MMDFNTFSAVVKDNIVSYIGEGLGNITPEIMVTTGINSDRHYISLTSDLTPNIKPSIRLEEEYERYKGQFNGNIDDSMNDLAEKARKSFRHPILKNFNEKFMDKSNIIPVLINTESNKKLLENVPHRDIEDMSVIYKFKVMDDDDYGFGTITIDNHLAEYRLSGVSEDELFDIAVKNQRASLPDKPRDLNEMIRSLMIADGMPEEVADMMAPQSIPGMYVLTNDRTSFGAAAILDADKMLDYREEIGGDFYIVPSSLHEVILLNKEIADSNGSVDEITEIVATINSNAVSEKDRLSNNIYVSDDTGKFKLATNVITKGIKDADYAGPEKSMTI